MAYLSLTCVCVSAHLVLFVLAIGCPLHAFPLFPVRCSPAARPAGSGHALVHGVCFMFALRVVPVLVCVPASAGYNVGPCLMGAGSLRVLTSLFVFSSLWAAALCDGRLIMVMSFLAALAS